MPSVRSGESVLWCVDPAHSGCLCRCHMLPLTRSIRKATLLGARHSWVQALWSLPVDVKHPNAIWVPNPWTPWEMGIRARALQFLLNSLTTELLNYVCSFLSSFLPRGCSILPLLPKKLPVSLCNLFCSLLLWTLQRSMRPKGIENQLMSPALWLLCECSKWLPFLQ